MTAPVTFTFEGRTVPALEGQTIAAALYAAGVRVFTRSFKYHRPRGLFCVSGDCPNCLMQVDSRPNVRTCVEPARQGQIVRGQNAWPSLDFDMLRVFDKLSAFLPVGFYYKRFHKPRWLWPLFERAVRHVAGLGRVYANSVPEFETEVEHLHTEVCVIGGGLTGMAAAAAAAEAGASVLLLERQPVLGGRLLEEQADSPSLIEKIASLTAMPRVRVLCNAHGFGLYEGNLVGAVRGQTFLKVRAGQIIVCTGSRERPFVFPNNDLPGVFLWRGVRRLAVLYGVRAGRRAVVLTDNDEGLLAALGLRQLGIEVVALIDRRPSPGLRGSGVFAQFPGLKISHGVVLSARGNKHLKAVRVARENEDGTPDPASEQEVACDLLCMAGEPVPANDLLLQRGTRFRYEGGRWQPEGNVPGLWAAGGAAGTLRQVAQGYEGLLRGAEAAAALGYQSPSLDTYRAQWESRPVIAPGPPTQSQERDGKCFVCLCEDVTAKDLRQAVAEGFDHIETLKRYSTVGMGPCQGKMCGQNFRDACARLTGRDVNAVGSTTARPPAVPVELAVLAAERRHHPVRRTPMHHWHQSAGARWIDAGQWNRPESYGDSADEIRAVRTGVGLIDVSTLGKIEVIGPDAAELLERIYINEWADLRVGRARYGVMCTEEGIIFDDGVGARLGPEHFYLTATTGNAEAVFQWLELWRATWRLNAMVLNRTSAFAAMNLAGPKARDVLSRLTTLDLSPASFPYLAEREGEVAGLRCRLLRIGFVGELGYEIHCPSCYGQDVWEAILAAGADCGLKPFGVEAQRILRLEKGHLIVGQDTDALSSPLGAGLERMVRFSKPRFHGREPLLRLKEMRPRTRLVGFHVEGAVPWADDGWARRLEGCQVVEQGRRPVGRVTSARYSPTLERYIGLAWVPAIVAGGRFSIRCDGSDLSASVTSTPFYDPEGKRLKG
jgi:sarcosine oxidase subunit alpha